MRETARDRHIVRLVYEYRILSQDQLRRLLGKSRSTVQQALVRLYHHQYLERVFLPVVYGGNSPTLYILGSRGTALLQRFGVEDFTGVPSKNLSALFLEHTLAINEVRIAVTQACQQLGWSIWKWRTESEIKAAYDRVSVTVGRKRQTVPVVPDSYFVVELPDRGVSHFFLELDRGTMTTERFKTKIAGYVAYYKSGAYEKRYNAQGFRVLTVVDSDGTGRVENLVAQTETVSGIGRRFWFARLSDVISESMLTAPVWRVAGSCEPAALFNNSG